MMVFRVSNWIDTTLRRVAGSCGILAILLIETAAFHDYGFSGHFYRLLAGDFVVIALATVTMLPEPARRQVWSASIWAAMRKPGPGGT